MTIIPASQTTIAWQPTFMMLDVDGTGDESCLVITSLYNDSGSGTPGSISIVRLTQRNQGGDLVIMEDCLLTNSSHRWNVWNISELPDGLDEDYAFAISTETGESQDYLEAENVIILASYDNQDDRFEEEEEFIAPHLYYGDDFVAAPSRTYVTYFQDFCFGSEETLCYTTAHNGGIFFWDPAGLGEEEDREIISRIAASQHGGWRFDEYTFGELGDVHRAAVLEGATRRFEDLGDIRVDNRLLFFADNTMGFLVYDISKPEEPQFVWQWDGDTRPREATGANADWDWQGAGDLADDSFGQAVAGEYPSETFGIDVAWYCDSEQEEPPVIHLYLACGIDGLRRFELSEFLDPFGYDDSNDPNELSFDDFSVDRYDEFEVEVGQESTDLWAYDIGTFCEDRDTYVFSSWREGREYNLEGLLGLTVHLDAGVAND